MLGSVELILVFLPLHSYIIALLENTNPLRLCRRFHVFLPRARHPSYPTESFEQGASEFVRARFLGDTCPDGGNVISGIVDARIGYIHKL